MNEQKMSWSELDEILSNDNTKVGVVVFKQNKNWRRNDYTLDELSYVVSGDNKYFNSKYCGTSIYGSNLAKNDIGVRLDWYMFTSNDDERWIVDYCYLLDENSQ